MKSYKLFILPILLILSIVLVVGTIASFDITVNNDDWHTSQMEGDAAVRYDNTTTLITDYNRAVSPTHTGQIYGDIDTSSIPIGDNIDSATLYFYIDSYTSSKGISKTYNVWMLESDETNYLLIDSGTFSSAGWYSVILTTPELLEIDKGDKTRIRLTVSDPGDLKARVMMVRSKEYSLNESFDMYMNITHSEGPCTNETLAREAIETGISQSLLGSMEIKTDLRLYIRYINGLQKLGSFDKFVDEGNQSWVFNYVTANESLTNMTSIGTSINIWEMENMTYSEIVGNVSGFINSTLF